MKRKLSEKKTKGRIKWLNALVLMICLLALIPSGSVQAATKYYSCKELGINNFTNQAIKSLKGNVVTYYKYKWKEDKERGYVYTVRIGNYNKAKITKQTKYYAADTNYYYQATKKGVSDYFQVRHLRKLNKKQFFNKENNFNIGKNRYTDSHSHMKISIKNGKITRIVQYGHVAE